MHRGSAGSYRGPTSSPLTPNTTLLSRVRLSLPVTIHIKTPPPTHTHKHTNTHTPLHCDDRSLPSHSLQARRPSQANRDCSLKDLRVAELRRLPRGALGHRVSVCRLRLSIQQGRGRPQQAVLLHLVSRHRGIGAELEVTSFLCSRPPRWFRRPGLPSHFYSIGASTHRRPPFCPIHCICAPLHSNPSHRAPDNAKIKQKMVYASSKDALRRALVGIGSDIQGTDLSEVAYDSGELGSPSITIFLCPL